MTRSHRSSPRDPSTAPSPELTLPRDPSTAPSPELTLPRGRHPVPTDPRMHTRRVPVALYVLTLLVVPVLVVTGFMSAGLWATTGSRTLTMTQTGASSGEDHTGAAAPASPADVKGSMTVQQVVEAFPPVTAAQILAKFDAPPDTPTSTQLKTLTQSGSGMDLPALRIWLEGEASAVTKG
ncbi:MAG: hypothetical protein ABI662_07885 [Dermatophilaceae bacterium]